MGAVRSFELGGTSTTAGRRWAARCSCGVVATTGAWPGAQPFGGWKGSGATGKGVGGPYYLLQFMHEQAQTIVEDA